MASFRLMHRQTGAVLSGYRVLCATEAEITDANHRLRESGSLMRFVIDLHPITPAETAVVCDPVPGQHPELETTSPLSS